MQNDQHLSEFTRYKERGQAGHLGARSPSRAGMEAAAPARFLNVHVQLESVSEFHFASKCFSVSPADFLKLLWVCFFFN